MPLVSMLGWSIKVDRYVAYITDCFRKWENITMVFLSSLPVTRAHHDAIWVIVNQVTKCAHFMLIQVTYSLEKLAQLYIKEIVSLHGVPDSIVSDRDPRITV